MAYDPKGGIADPAEGIEFIGRKQPKAEIEMRNAIIDPRVIGLPEGTANDVILNQIEARVNVNNVSG